MQATRFAIFTRCKNKIIKEDEMCTAATYKTKDFLFWKNIRL